MLLIQNVSKNPISFYRPVFIMPCKTIFFLYLKYRNNKYVFRQYVKRGKLLAMRYKVFRKFKYHFLVNAMLQHARQLRKKLVGSKQKYKQSHKGFKQLKHNQFLMKNFGLKKYRKERLYKMRSRKIGALSKYNKKRSPGNILYKKKRWVKKILSNISKRKHHYFQARMYMRDNTTNKQAWWQVIHLNILLHPQIMGTKRQNICLLCFNKKNSHFF